jgi:hypothetical protein
VDKAFIIHFAPIELYPPVQNLLRELERGQGTAKVLVLTTANRNRALNVFRSDSQKVKIFRFGAADQSMNAFYRYWNYFKFYLGCLLMLMRHRPGRVLYFETLSSFPVYIYKRFLKRHSQVLIHYHEYSTPQQYAKGMKLERFFHALENYLYPKAIWVSHTNEFRMNKFKEDIQPITFENGFILPNYPPSHWATKVRGEVRSPLRIVYVGALSIDTMYTMEFATWVVQQAGRVCWDIYSYNYSPEAKQYFEGLGNPWVNLKEGVDYDELPGILQGYDVGVILYNGHIPNYIYNAPNKLFEYMACGLAVWFPHIMIGSLGYCTKETYPEVLALDFTKLDDFKFEEVLRRPGSTLKESSFFSESVLPFLIDKLAKHD